MFTTHNILELSRIRQGKFKANHKEIKIGSRVNDIFKSFVDDITFREIDYEIKIQQNLVNQNIIIDDMRFGIVFYNLIHNSV